MIPRDKVKEIALQLREKTLRGEIEWIAEIDEPSAQEQYELALGKSIIELAYFRPATEPDSIVLRIRSTATPTNLPVGYLEAESSMVESDDWKLLSALRDAIFQKVTKWDDVLREIDDVLKKSGTIGASS